MPDVIIGESRHGEIAMVVALQEPDPRPPTLSVLRRGVLEVFGEELFLVVEVVGGSLFFQSPALSAKKISSG